MLRVLLLLVVAGLSVGCSMFTAWRSIPPPGGCDQCHSLPLNNNWQATYQVAQLNSERSSQPYFQTAEYTMAQTSQQPVSAMERQKVAEEKCFVCHKAPSKAHLERAGKYHHGGR